MRSFSLKQNKIMTKTDFILRVKTDFMNNEFMPRKQKVILFKNIHLQK